MPKGLIEDIKPKNSLIEDTKPKNLAVEDTKPRNTVIGLESEVDQLYTQILTAGMYMGIPPHTYSEAGTVLSPFSP